MAVLACFQSSSTLSVTEVGRLLDLSPATAHRLLRALTEVGFVDQDQSTSRYRLGPGLAAWGALTSRRLGFEAARPELEDLAARLGLSVTLGINQGEQSLTVETVRARGDDAIAVLPGARTPFYACAMGKSISAFDNEVYSAADAPLARFTRNTIVSTAGLQAELARIRAQGWAMNNEEFQLGVKGIGAPIRDEHGRVIAAVAVAASTAHLTTASLELAAAAVTASAERLGSLIAVT
jgi:DNA-binding IclR family transcriptional regulator